ncbi:hypothetical protein J3R83DRAFT_5274 [Lanmaoa asiatica]|nr:hypothetical protein J3R83DRAFT_5274 [Lanmaoa asiatica]
MAQPSGSPEDLGRQTSLPWTPGEGGESLMQAIQALETYKKKDPSKGPFHALHTSRVSDEGRGAPLPDMISMYSCAG